MPENMRTTPTAHLVLPDWRDTLGDTDTTPLAFGVMRHKSPSVGEIGEHPATESFCTKDGASSASKKKKKRKKKRREKKQKNGRDKKISESKKVRVS